MPARDRTDAVDWSAVENEIEAQLPHYPMRSCACGSCVRMRHALAAVRLVRAIETASGFASVSEFLAETAARLREIEAMSNPLAAEYARSTAAKLTAVQRALDASKGEG